MSIGQDYVKMLEDGITGLVIAGVFIGIIVGAIIGGLVFWLLSVLLGGMT